LEEVSVVETELEAFSSMAEEVVIEVEEVVIDELEDDKTMTKLL